MVRVTYLELLSFSFSSVLCGGDGDDAEEEPLKTKQRLADPLKEVIFQRPVAPEPTDMHLQLLGLASAGGCPGELAVSDSPDVQADCPPLLVWRCQDANGLFSMFSVALGHLTACDAKGQALLVDWSSERLLYQGPPGEPNLWNVFFQQPAEHRTPREVLLRALRQHQYQDTQAYYPVFGCLRGVVQGYGLITPKLAAQGRALCARHIVLQPRFKARLCVLAEKLLGRNHRWLAVHVRRGDKAIEAKANFQLTDDAISARIVLQCRSWRCSGVFLCSDDAALKRRLEARLSLAAAQGGPGLAVSVYPALLPAEAGQAAHMDRSLEGYQKAEDVVAETFLMARYCHGLLSTLSNVSAAVVYLSPPGFPYSTFWEPMVQLCEPRSCRLIACRPKRVRVFPRAASGA